MSKPNILITGANGFVGGGVLARVVKAGFNAVSVSRKVAAMPAAVKQFQIAALNSATPWQQVITDCQIDVIVHAAARVHQMADDAANPLAAFRAVNTEGTLNLARQAAESGVKRFIFISSVKVNGEKTITGKPFSAGQPVSPQDAYGLSKAEAEQQLMQLAKETKMEIVIIRPPLVYGYGVKANFAAMLNLAKKNLPLPLGAIDNRRSLVALDNLVDLVVTCIDHPKAANQIFLVSDDRDVSTTELLKLMTCAAGKKPRLLPVPVSWLRLAGKLTGKQAVIDRLCGNLQLDIEHTKATLNWTPPISVEEGIKRCFMNEDLC
ncbi:UDP-glucose 4-epimerase family protein [Arsukibacterium indicum]|uniref:SDR family oxidoreductase n=1 Tax=Arsukibacterium indicum TaxID=2848612 RepID=A0ABS6MG56_9GAMM|nr:SDR family oxidoreductase [Arsukibacterium indicum]MBV2127798.1 SDR family oxidoreductase [Arsukibacterium indicum]